MKENNLIKNTKETLLGIIILPVLIHGMIKAFYQEDEHEEIVPKKISKKSLLMAFRSKARSR